MECMVNIVLDDEVVGEADNISVTQSREPLYHAGGLAGFAQTEISLVIDQLTISRGAFYKISNGDLFVVVTSVHDDVGMFTQHMVNNCFLFSPNFVLYFEDKVTIDSATISCFGKINEI
jgi:hypothetical protein